MYLLSYKDLAVWQRGVALVTDIYRLTDSFPRSELYGLTSQLRRSAVSVPVNVAEGHGRSTTGEYRNQLSVASGSLNELETLLIISSNLGFAVTEKLFPVHQELSELQKMTWKLQKELRSRPSRTVR